MSDLTDLQAAIAAAKAKAADCDDFASVRTFVSEVADAFLAYDVAGES